MNFPGMTAVTKRELIQALIAKASVNAINKSVQFLHASLNRTLLLFILSQRRGMKISKLSFFLSTPKALRSRCDFIVAENPYR